MKKEDSLNQPNKALNFWLCAGLLALLLASIMARDITRPFYGLHSWGHAHDAWVARSHINYGLGYTKGFDTFAVGNPPDKNPTRYLDHPVLFTLLNSAAMVVLGVNTWSMRATNILATIVALLLFLKILRGLLDDRTTLLAGLLFCLFPLITYFGVNMWLYPLTFTAFWCYLVLIGGIKDGPHPKKFHKVVLAVSLLLALQMTWEGFFFAMTIGVHYVFRCIRRKQLPEKTLLTILIVAPLSSLMLDFVILAAGHNWDFQRIVELAKWRAGSGEIRNLTWAAWFGRFCEHAVTNFTLPVLITTIVYLTFGQLLAFASLASDKQKTEPSRRFPQFWLFFMPAAFQLLILKGTLWPHQYWERPLVPFIAIATALGIMSLYDILKKVHQRLAVAGAIILIGICFVYCMIGTNYYYAVRWQPVEKIRMFQMLNRKIPPDKALLSFEPHIIDQKPGVKAASYRPEVAWYLDRDIVAANVFKVDGRVIKNERFFVFRNPKIMVAETMKDIQQKASTGKFPYYLVPAVDQLSPLISQLRKNYTFEYIQGEPSKRTKDGKFLRAGMMPYMIFDLSSKPANR